MSNPNCIFKRDFFGELIAYQTNDAWGDILVTDHRQYRYLKFDSKYKQSSMDVKKPHILVDEYTRAMMLVLAFIKPQHVTLLGLGGGSLLRSLAHILPQCVLHTVELRQRVYEVASEFFGIPNSKKITITISDAKHQLEDTDAGSTNIIFADMYNAYGMNSTQVEKHFITQCHHALSDEGWLVVNYHEMPDLNIPFFKYLCSLFLDVFVCPIPGANYILFASKYRIGTFDQFDSEVIALEKRLEVKVTHLFKRFSRLI